jgi:hypothetical protein
VLLWADLLCSDGRERCLLQIGRDREGKGRDSRRDTGTNRLIVNQTDRKSERETDRGRLMTERL